MRTYLYRKHWTPYYKKYPKDELSVERARKYYEQRKPHVVIAMDGDDVRVLRFNFLGDSYGSVLFLDQYLRTHMIYSFSEVEGPRLFIEEVAIQYYEGIE